MAFLFEKYFPKIKPGVLLRRWKLLNSRKVLYLPRILTVREKRFYVILLLIVLASGISIVERVYHRFTISVPDAGGSYTEGLLKEPRTINPIYASQDADRDLTRLIFSGLFTYNGAGVLKPDLAQDYKISKDGKTYTVTLKKNLFWQDGEKLTADDVVFTLRTIQNPQYNSVLRANWQGVGVERLDDQTIRFTLRTPYAPFIENLTVGVLPAHLWKGVSPEQALLNELNLKPVGSGPFTFDKYSQASDGSLLWYRVARNTKYYREGPYLSDITFVFYKTEEGLVAAWHKGDIDGFGPANANLIQGLDREKISVYSVGMPRIFGIFFNGKKAPVLNDKSVRQAITYALNRNEIVQKIGSGGAVPTGSPLPFINQSTDFVLNYNPEKAKQLLESAGWKDWDGNGIREIKTKSKGKSAVTPLHFTLVTSDWPDLLKTADIIKTELKGVGIDITIEKHSFTELDSSIIKPRNFEILLFGQDYGYEYDPFAFWHSSQIKSPGLNITFYANKKVDRLLEDARQAVDSSVRQQKYQQFSNILLQDLPADFLYSQLYVYLLPTDIHGVDLEKISLPSDRFNEINKWYEATKRVFK